MNGSAAVEFETSVPLFFDSYALNRTTGSFILIDPISNATVGAAMIREDLSRNKGGRVPEFRSFEEQRLGAVTSEEQYQRHGHRSAIFSVVGNRAFAERLERLLFERGFAVGLVRAKEVPSISLPAVLSALRGVGTAIIHSSDAGSREQRAVLAQYAGECLFEIPAAGKNEDSEKALEQALATAETLRIGNREAGKGKADENARTQ